MSLIFRDNIRQLVEQMGVNISEFSEIIGEKPSRVNDVLQGKQRPPFDMVEKIINSLQVDANWLITGIQSNGNNSENNRPHQESDDYEYIPVYDVEASAGFGMPAYGASEPVSHLAFRKDWLKMRGLYPKDLSIITAKGDSMEPTIESGNTLLVDASKSNPRDGHIYVILSNEALWVKRVQRQFDGSLLLLSDNPAYPPQTLDFKNHPDVQVIGQVVNVSKDLA